MLCVSHCAFLVCGSNGFLVVSRRYFLSTLDRGVKGGGELFDSPFLDFMVLVSNGFVYPLHLMTFIGPGFCAAEDAGRVHAQQLQAERCFKNVAMEKIHSAVRNILMFSLKRGRRRRGGGITTKNVHKVQMFSCLLDRTCSFCFGWLWKDGDSGGGGARGGRGERDRRERYVWVWVWVCGVSRYRRYFC